MRRLVIDYFVLFYILGIAIASWLLGDLSKHSFLIFIAAIILLIAAVFVNWFLGSKLRPAVVVCLFCFVGIFIGVWRYELTYFIPGENHIAHYANQRLEFYAKIVSEPDLRPDQTKYLLGDIVVLGSGKSLEGTVLISAPSRPAHRYGERLSIICNINRPAEIDGFAYDRYLAKADIFAVCYEPQIERVSDKSKLTYIEATYQSLFRLKNFFRQIYDRNLRVDEASLANGIILGDQKIMAEGLRSSYARSGLAHIIAISGMNMTLIASFVLLLLIWLGFWRRQAFYMTLIFVWLYTVMIGLPSAAVRASVMSSILLFALAYGYLARFDRLAYLTAAVMLTINPLLLRDDTGFQLSFAALLGIAYFHKPFMSLFEKLRYVSSLPGFVTESFVMTLAAQVFGWPIMVNSFNQFSLIAPLANIFAAPLLAPIMVLLIVAAIATLIIPQASLLLFAPINILLSYLNFIAVLFGRPSWATLEIGSFGYILTVLYYCSMLYIVVKKKLY